MLGIFISIATIFMLISLSLGLQGAVKEQFETLGADKFFVQPSTGFLGPPGSVGGTILREEDVNTIKSVRGVKDVADYIAGNAKIEFAGTERYMLVWGVALHTNLFAETGNLEVNEGRFLQQGDSGVNLGINHKEGNLWGKPVKTGNKLIINGQDFKVRGVFEKIGNPDDDQMVVMSLESARELFNIPERVDWIVVQIDEGEDILEVADRVEKKLRNLRDVTEKNQDFDILTPDQLLESFGNILNIVTAFLAGVAAISLIVGAIGIANTMYTSVIERTREIGVMKAIGAQNKDVLMIFLIESGMLGLVGGIIGVSLGLGVSKTIEYIAITSLNTNLLQAAAPTYLILGCLGFGFLIGAISGILPAMQASKTNVVDALRYE
ncbi:MAG: ABC transporter permease [Nanoarchaeota archaeon]|nr:ABC transporter permease [Nanoarchaeota archaeon]